METWYKSKTMRNQTEEYVPFSSSTSLFFIHILSFHKMIDTER